MVRVELGSKPTKEELEFDRAVRDEIARLRPIVERIPTLEKHVAEARRNYENAATPKEQDEARLARARAVQMLERAQTARAELSALEKKNPRALGRSWLRPNDIAKNGRLMAELQGLEQRISAIRAQIKPEYPPVK